jgi:hypothetical protein
LLYRTICQFSNTAERQADTIIGLPFGGVLKNVFFEVATGIVFVHKKAADVMAGCFLCPSCADVWTKEFVLSYIVIVVPCRETFRRF